MQHPRLLEKLGVFKSIDLDITSGDFDRVGESFLEDGLPKLDITYICLDDETLSLQTGLRLNHQFRKQQIPIVLRMVESGGLALLLGDGAGEKGSFRNLRVFDLLDQTCTAELLSGGTHEVLARSLHKIYLDGALRRSVESKQDEALNDWDELPEELKENNRQLADRIPIMLAAAGYRIAAAD